MFKCGVTSDVVVVFSGRESAEQYDLMVRFSCMWMMFMMMNFPCVKPYFLGGGDGKSAQGSRLWILH